ncbi:MAG: hypothetical protein HY329_11575 [Chloroflexi bacterium]|nr:hypothetical protein [Chloroflexota bacterium]
MELAGAAEMKDDLLNQAPTRINQISLLCTATVDPALVAGTPVGVMAAVDYGRETVAPAQSPGAAFEESGLADEGATMVGARVETGVGDDLIETIKKGRTLWQAI